MTAYTDLLADTSREEVWLLKLYLDQCQKYNPEIGGLDSSGGFDTCNATENCRYTFGTCKDTDSYEKGTLTHKFVNRGARLLGAKDLLLKNSIDHQPTKIEHGKFRTELGEKTFQLEDFTLDPNGWDLSNPAKMDYSLSDEGRFLPNFVARHKYFQGRIAELLKGFKGLDEADFVLDFRGILYDMDWATSNTLEVVVRDLLWKTGTKTFPNEIPSNVVLNGTLLVGETTDLPLEDGSGNTYDPTDHFEVASAEQPRCVKVDDEYILYTATAAGKLTGVLTRGAYGTTPAEHADGVEIVQVVVYAEDDSGTWAGCTGLLADVCILDMIIHHAGISGDYIETLSAADEYGLTLDGGIDDVQTDFNLSIDSAATLDLPDQGVLKIDDEFIYYDALDSVQDPIDCKRGMFGSVKAAHANAATVEVTAPTDAFGQYRPGLLLPFRMEDQNGVDAKIQTFRQSTLMDPFTNEDGNVDFKMLIPESSRTLTASDIIANTTSVKTRSLEHYTRSIVYYNPNTPDPKTAQSSKDAWRDYTDRWGYINAADETANAYDEIRIKPIYAEWLRDANDAKWTAAHYNSRYADPAPQITFSLELKDDTLRVGQLINLADPKIVDEDGVAISDIYEIISKMRKGGTNKIEFLAERSGLAFSKYGRIGPKNGFLEDSIDDSETVIVIDLSESTLTAADWRTGGTHQVRIDDEEISYTLAEEDSNQNVVISGGARGVNGTTPVAHSIESSAGTGPDVMMLFSAASDDMRNNYAWIGDSVNNFLDGNGDFSVTLEGYIIY